MKLEKDNATALEAIEALEEGKEVWHYGEQEFLVDGYLAYGAKLSSTGINIHKKDLTGYSILEPSERKLKGINLNDVKYYPMTGGCAGDDDCPICSGDGVVDGGVDQNDNPINIPCQCIEDVVCQPMNGDNPCDVCKCDPCMCPKEDYIDIEPRVWQRGRTVCRYNGIDIDISLMSGYRDFMGYVWLDGSGHKYIGDVPFIIENDKVERCVAVRMKKEK